MEEFGEKLRSLREERGMTQQTLAEQLYVTRQAVSRWECGARYPDLLMAKRIADTMEVSVDELISGEEMKRDMEKEKVLKAPLAGTVQTMLYAIAFIAWLLITFIAGLILTSAKTEGMPVTITNISGMIGNGLFLFVLGLGLYFSVKEKLSPRKTAVMMSAVFFISMCIGIVSGIAEGQKNNAAFIPYFVSIMYNVFQIFAVYTFFTVKRRVSPVWVYLVAALYALNAVRLFFVPDFSTAGSGYEQFVLVIAMGIRAMFAVIFSVLLVYQAYMLDKKRREVS